MTVDHAEEQEMEAEALEAIFDTHFHKLTKQTWAIEIYPESTGEVNHIACKLLVELPETYPETLPKLSIEILQGLAQEHADLLTNLANKEALANQGLPSIYAIAERLKEWLFENNVKGLDDLSMHAQMLRKQQLQQQKPKQDTIFFEAQVQQDVLTEAEREDLDVRKRREEGTPCNKENFEAWKARFEEEMTVKNQASRTKVDETMDRQTGYQFFSDKANNFQALEAAAEQAELADVDDELFEDDVDLDDLDFDDDSDDDDDDDDEIDI